MSGPLFATLIIAMASVCYGLVPLFARVLLATGLSVEAVALYRFCLALPLALVFLPRTRASLGPVITLAGVGLAGGLGWTAYLNAIQQVPVASAGVIYMSYPLFVVVLARLLLGQSITPRAMFGAGLVVTGAIVVNAGAHVPVDQWPTLLSILPAPAGFALIVVAISAVGRELGTMQRWSAVAFGHVVGLLPAAMLAESGSLLPATAGGWVWIAAIALVTSTLPQILHVFAARFVSVARSSAAGAAELPTMMAVGWLAFGEVVGPREAIGALLVIAAIAVTPAMAPAGRRLPRFLAGASEGRA